jgi:hypothetical protein
MYVDDIFISPKYVLDSDCIDLFIKLTNKSNKESWDKAIDIFEDRIKGRFLNIVNSLLDESKQDRSLTNGFSIMALNCLLVETLQQFYLGLEDTRRNSKNSFVNFLTQSPYFNGTHRKYSKMFGKSFTGKSAELFYTDVRCGILHQAETKNNVMLTYYGTYLVDDGTNPGWLMFDVGWFTKALNLEFDRYVTRLKDNQQEDIRNNFCIKWRFIIDRAIEVKKTNTYKTFI